MKQRATCFISTGEFSGDLLAADLVQALKTTGAISSFFGITGDALEQSGVRSIGTISELSVMGIVEVIKKLPSLVELEARIICEVDRCQPDIAILVDFPGFHFRLADQLKLRGIKVVQYVAPKLWAWGENRAHALRENFDAVLGILPFEEKYFQSLGINYEFVGCPQIDRISKVSVTSEHFALTSGEKLVACLPGSRMDEVSRMLPVINSIARRIRMMDPNSTYRFLVPVSQNLDFHDVVNVLGSFTDGKVCDKKAKKNNLMAGACSSGQDNMLDHGQLTFMKGMSLEILSIADAAIVTSGTATLECGLLGTPMTVVYAMDELSYDLAKARVKISEFSLINIVAGKRIVNEYIQHFEEAEIAREMLGLLNKNDLAGKMQQDFEDVKSGLPGGAATNAARAITALLSH